MEIQVCATLITPLMTASAIMPATSHVSNVYGGVAAYWTAEGATLAASAPTFGRFELEQRMPFDRVERVEMFGPLRPAEALAGRHMQDLPAEPPIPQQRRDVGMAAEAPMAVFFPEEDRRRGLDFAIVRIGIAEECGIARIERDLATSGLVLRRHRCDLQCRG